MRLIPFLLVLVTMTNAVGGRTSYCALSLHGAFSTVSCEPTALPQFPTPLTLVNAHAFVQVVLPQFDSQPHAASSLSPLRVKSLALPFAFFEDPPKHPPRFSFPTF